MVSEVRPIVEVASITMEVVIMEAASIIKTIAITAVTTAVVLETKAMGIAVIRTTREIKTAEVSDKVVVFKTIREAPTQTAEDSEMKVIAIATITAITDQNLPVVVGSGVAQAAQRVQVTQVVQTETLAALDKTIINKETNS